MERTRADDAQIVFCSVLILAGAFVAGAPAKLLVRLSSLDPASPSLISRIGPQPGLEQTLGVFHAAFVMLPAAVAFLAIGLPVLIGYLARSIHDGWDPGESLLLTALTVAIAAVIILPHTPLSFLVSILFVVALSAAGCWPLLRRHGSLIGFRILAVGGLTLFGLAYYEYRLLTTGTPSRTMAPTLLVVAVLTLVAGLPTVTIGEATRGLGRLAVVALMWTATAIWATLPFVRGMADSSHSADWLELRATALLAVVLVAAELVHQRSRQQHDGDASLS